MALEIERKFLLPQVPAWISDCPSGRIEQGYLTAREDSIQVRVRLKDGDAILAVKRGTGLSREETETDLAPEQADALWPLTEGRRIEKVRYQVEHGGMTIEVDAYEGGLEGLVVAEVEFASEEESERFDGPDWLGEELTGRREFDNEWLAEQGLPAELR